MGTQVIDILKQFPDLARSLARLSLGRGGPRDLYGVLMGLRSARSILQIIDNTSNVTGRLRSWRCTFVVQCVLWQVLYFHTGNHVYLLNSFKRDRAIAFYSA